MKNNQLIGPLLSMTATLFMCALLSVCKTSLASNHSTEFYSDNESFIIKRNTNEAIYQVNGKTFTYEQLNETQKKAVSKIEKKLKKLEMAVDIESDEMEARIPVLESKMEAIEIQMPRIDEKNYMFLKNKQKNIKIY